MRMTTDQVEDALESGELPLTRLVRESVQKERERLVSIAREAIDEKYIL